MPSLPRSNSGRSQVSRIIRAPGSWLRRNIARSIACAATRGSSANGNSSDASSNSSRRRRWRISTFRQTTTSGTISCASCSFPAIRSSRPRRASRSPARVGESGQIVLLLDQDRGRWDALHISRGLAALVRAEKLGGVLGPYALQAAIAACHARARTAAETDWARIAALYDALAQVMPSPVVELNRAVAVGMAFGPAAGLELVDALVSEPSLKAYQFLPSVRGDF